MNNALQRLTDNRIKRGIARGDRRALELLYEAYARPLYSYALAIAGTSQDAEDAAQTLLCKLLRNPSLLEKIDRLQSYLYRGVRNEALDLCKSRKKEVFLDGDALFEEIFAAGDSAVENRVLLRQAIGKLRPDQREVIVLKTWIDMSFREIADLVGASQNTVQSRYRYALEKLKEALGEER